MTFGIALTIDQRDQFELTMALDQRWNFRRSSGGTPSISAMTIVGSGRAKSPIRSIRRRPRTSASSEPATASTRGRSSSTSRGVKAFCTSARSRVWSGGSTSSMLRLSGRNIAGIHGARCRLSDATLSRSLTNRSSFRTDSASS